MENVADISSDCIYDSTLTPPSTIPTRTGYTFKGWRVRPQIHFSRGALALNQMTGKYGKGVYNNEDYCNYTYQSSAGGGPEYCRTNANYTELQQNEWKAVYRTGSILYGMSGCSSQVGTDHQRGSPPIDGGRYCWCKATGVNYAGTLYGPDTTLYWMYLRVVSNAVACARDCATLCGHYIGGDAATTDRLFLPPSDN